MTDYIAISDTQVDPDAPLTSGLGYSWRDNPIAIAEGSPDAPIMAAAWHPHDAVLVGDGNDGLFYDFAVDGVIASAETPLFADGYEYRIVLTQLSHNGSGPDLTVEFYRETSAAYGTAFVIASSVGVYASGTIDLIMPRKSDLIFNVPFYVSTPGEAVTSSQMIFFSVSPAQKISKCRIKFSSGSLDGGTIALYRRRIYGPDF